MEQFQQIINFIYKYEIILFLIYILLSFIFATITDKIFIASLKRIVKKTKTDIDDQIIDVLHPAIYNSILYIGFYMAFNIITIPIKIQSFLGSSLKTIIVFYWSIGLFRSFMTVIKWASNKDNDRGIIKKKTIPLFDNIGKIVIFLISVYFIMLSWGINVTAWIASAGILSVVIGFAAKDTLGNIFSGIFIMADSPYKEGDYINLDTGERGYVQDIGIRSTRIMTRDNIEIIIPNSVIASSKIINESGGPQEMERIRISVDVAYGTEVEKVKKIMYEIAKSSENVCNDPNPHVRFRAFGESGLRFELLSWIELPELRGRVTDELLTNIYNSFNSENIEIPFPQRTLHIKKTD